MSIFAISAFGAKKIIRPDEFKEAQHMVFGLQKRINRAENFPHKSFAFVDLTSRSDKTHANTVVNWHNSLHRDLDVLVSVGLQKGSDPGDKLARVKVLYAGQKHRAEQLATAIASSCGLVNGGAEARNDLSFLTATQMPAVLIRIHFPTGLPHYIDNYTTILRNIADILCTNAPGQLHLSLDGQPQIRAKPEAVSVASE